MLILWRRKFFIEVTKGHLKILKSSFSAIYYLFDAWYFLKLLKNVNIMKTHNMKYDLIGHPRSSMNIFMPNLSSTLVNWPILMKICKNANIKNTQFFHKIIYDLKFHFMLWRRFVFFFTLRPSDLITTLTYVLMDIFLSLCFTTWNLKGLKQIEGKIYLTLRNSI